MNVVAYIRVSTDGQTGEDKYGMDVQKQIIEDYCSEHGHTVVKWIYDAGESGAKLRPNFQAICDEEHNPPVGAVVVAKSDRVARDIQIYYYYKMILRMKNIQLISVSEDFDSLGPFASMLEAFTLCVAEMERENIRNRMSGGRTAKAAKGGYAGGKVPYGYAVRNKSWSIDPDEAEVVKRIFTLRSEGASLREICDILDRQGVTARNGKAFYPSTVKGILDNERTYKGEYRYSGSEWVKGTHPAIL